MRLAKSRPTAENEQCYASHAYRSPDAWVLTNVCKACEFVQYAVEQGAKVVALLKLFNTDYLLPEATYDYTEPRKRVKAIWLYNGARSLGCCLAGFTGKASSSAGCTAAQPDLARPDGQSSRLRSNA